VLATALLAIVVCVIAATSGQPIADTRVERAHLPVTKMQVESLPESPVLNWSPARRGWAAALASVPARLPQVAPTTTCDSGPTLTLYFSDGSTMTYECGLPASILHLRDRLIALAQGNA
jgi:hypothetical protein